jgi:transposase
MLATLANVDGNFSDLFSHARQYTHRNILLSSTHFTGRSMYSIVIYALKKLSPLSEVIPMEPREIKGLEIAAKSKVIRKGKSNLWLVPSQSGQEEKYTVAMRDEKPECTCRDFEFRNTKCKHIFAVEYTIQREQTADGRTVVTETVKVTRKTYTQNWPAYNAAQTQEKSQLQALLYELCKNLPEPEQRRGRPRLSLADIIFASTFKIYSTVSGRRFQSDLQEAKRRGFLSKMPSYNSVFRYLEAEALTPYLYELIATSALPLKSVEHDFAVDSSGFSTGQFMRWFDVKYGKEEDRRMWLKVHLMCGVKTNIVTSVEISNGYANDHGYFKPLLEATAGNGFTMKEVSADKAYLSGENLLTTLRHKAIPYIPFKSNSKAQTSYGPKSTLWTRMLSFYNDHREEFLTHYHKRSNVETTFHMIKSKFGQRLRSKTLTAQINEALCKVLCHNLCVVIQSQHELGIDVDFSEANAA